MTLLEEIITGASGDEPVTNLLRKVKVVAARADVPDLEEWVDHELNGYPPDAALPDYRGPFEAEVRAHLGGPFGAEIKNAPVPSLAFPEDYRDGYLFNIVFNQPLAEIEDLSKGESLSAPWRANEVAIINSMVEAGKVTLQPGYHLLTASRVVNSSQLVSIVEAVRTRILDLALTIEKTHPEAGQAGSDPLPTDATQTIVTNVFGGNPNVAVASHEFTQTVEVTEGDWERLKEYLLNLGLAESEIADLSTALESDKESDSGDIGPSTAQWLGLMAAKTAGQLGVGTSAGLIANAISQYLGLG